MGSGMLSDEQQPPVAFGLFIPEDGDTPILIVS